MQHASRLLLRMRPIGILIGAVMTIPSAMAWLPQAYCNGARTTSTLQRLGVDDDSPLAEAFLPTNRPLRPRHRWWLRSDPSSRESGIQEQERSTEASSLQDDVRSSREVRQLGTVGGTVFMGLAALVGIPVGLWDATLVEFGVVVVLVLWVGRTWDHCEFQTSKEEEQKATRGVNHPSYFKVRPSLIPDAGMGLFAMQHLDADDFLMEYTGERLTETEYFARYPHGDGRYVACIDEPLPVPSFVLEPFGMATTTTITKVGQAGRGGRLWHEPIYIDGADPSLSGMARFMNSLPKGQGANVYWKKQRHFGGAMYFYASRNIEAGEELCFDYTSTYWDAASASDQGPEKIDAESKRRD